MKLAAAGNRISQIFEARSVERVTRLANLVLLLAIAWTLARMTWLLIPAPPVEQAPPQAVGISAASGKTQGASSIADLVALHLFGVAPTEAPAPETVTAAPETQLNLTLRGLLASDTEGDARAIIAAPNKDEAPYAVGDQLPGNATLKQILTDRVILLRNGRYETLSLPRDEPAGAGMRQRSLPGVPPSAQGSLKELRDNLLNNPQTLSDLVQIQPVRDGNELQGYRLTPGRDAQMLGRYGLRPGDVVTAVNGVALSSPEGSARALQSITSADVISLTVLRNGRQESFTFRME